MSPTHTPRIAVVGSLNMDLVLQVQHAPGPGETVLADALHLVPGGKGGNQAVACARQGAQVALFGRVGDDGYGHTLRIHVYEGSRSPERIFNSVVMVDEKGVIDLGQAGSTKK